MRKTRWLAAFFLPLLLVSFLQSQSLADLAKKEKERRAALKGKSATVVTEAELAKVKKRPAVEAGAQEQTSEEAAAQSGTAQAGQPAAGGQQEAAPPAAGEQPAQGAAQVDKPVTELPPGESPAVSAQDIQKKQNELADIAQQKADMVDLLTTKMNSLYQQFYGLDNVKSRELVQAQISDTYDKLLKAETDSAKAQKDLADYMAQTKKGQTPTMWIK
jgi:hypothetical protein